jgi:hypothetical protein
VPAPVGTPRQRCGHNAPRAGGAVVGILGPSGTGATVTSKAHMVVGADGKHSMIADAVQAPCCRRHAAMTVACYSCWSGVPLSAGELYQRPGCAAAAFPTNDNLIMAYIATPPIADFAEWLLGVFAGIVPIQGYFSAQKPRSTARSPSRCPRGHRSPYAASAWSCRQRRC